MYLFEGEKNPSVVIKDTKLRIKPEAKDCRKMSISETLRTILFAKGII